MSDVDPRLVAALTAQLGLWRVALAETRSGSSPRTSGTCGSIVQVPVKPGAEVTADLGPLGRAELKIASPLGGGSDPPPGGR